MWPASSSLPPGFGATTSFFEFPGIGATASSSDLGDAKKLKGMNVAQWSEKREVAFKSKRKKEVIGFFEDCFED